MRMCHGKIGHHRANGSADRLVLFTLLLAFTFLALFESSAHPDEGGVSFWLPGQYGSFAAIAADPGFSLPMVTYFYAGSASGSQALERGRTLDFGL
jgi:hypothetical protein